MFYIKSPMNYTGNKYKSLNQLLKLFPKDIDKFVDLFCGGLDVSLNVQSKLKYCNDIEEHIIDFYNNIKNLKGSEVNKMVLDKIAEYKLNRENKDNYLILREHYNKSENKNWLEFFTLISHSFNNQLRFNQKGQFNMPFGERCYNERLQENLQYFVDAIDDSFIFTNLDFTEMPLLNMNLTSKSFVYCDPPYLITTATYNENNGWTKNDEIKLYETLNKLNTKNIKFGLSNVIEHDGKRNILLEEWLESKPKFKIKEMKIDHDNCSYRKANKPKTKTREVYIYNY